VIEKYHSMVEFASCLYMTKHGLYAQIKHEKPQQLKITESGDSLIELAKLKKELQRVTEERDILKKLRCNSQVSPNEVCLYSGQSAYLINLSFVFNSGCSP